MHPSIASHEEGNPIPIWPVTPANLDDRIAALGDDGMVWVKAHGFTASAGQTLVVPGTAGAISGVLFGLGKEGDPARTPFLPGKLPGVLPAGVYKFSDPTDDDGLAGIAWALGSYKFDAFVDSKERARPQLVLPEQVSGDYVLNVVEGVELGRDLINSPANHMGPDELEGAVRHLSERYGATLQVVSGDALLSENFPLIYEVGKGSDRAPRLLDLTWGDATAPKVTLVGKGVCFDTGGLDIKPSAAMLLMKKDMGGAAATIGLAAMIMATGLNIRLRLLVPAVENSISGNAFRPGDVLASRKGDSVEIGNTDAEGRLVLADALTLACEEEPDLLIDMATLTGAARVALGPELVPFYTDSQDLASDLASHAVQTHDPLWQMPLWNAYKPMIKSGIADINNAGKGGFAGSITAALFLKNFVNSDVEWVHFDMYGWVPTARPGQPEGGEVQAIRALFSMLSQRYAS